MKRRGFLASLFALPAAASAIAAAKPVPVPEAVAPVMARPQPVANRSVLDDGWVTCSVSYSIVSLDRRGRISTSDSWKEHVG